MKLYSGANENTSCLLHIISLAKGKAIFVSAFFPKLRNYEPKEPPD